ncbi:cyclohexanone monooxygenase [Paraphoma chrysanthemicola]|uniref:Cyclohexanone monooxygenase n=1 Tax=Paraphoma chrysanthemicola TaxID=798071 RepID=A0A8K0QZX0_9PLEO|nr:cyclohexanone monooxygenase [Paraphoma chrysanthemicola]
MPSRIQESNETRRTHAGPYRVQDRPHSQRRQWRIIGVGAGASGLYLAHQVEKRMSLTDLVIYEKNSDVGGTWLENIYPGCACDVPSHIYTYSFRPNPKYTSYYAGSTEIQQYFKEFTDENNLQKYIRFGMTVTSAVWDSEKGIYQVKIQDANGTIHNDWCNALINCSGVLNNWKWPDIPNRESFKGEMLHSAAWDPKFDGTAKRVAVIGIGSSGIQILPKVQKIASSVSVFIRSPVWITPQLGGLPDGAPSPIPDDKAILKDILLRGQQPFDFTPEEILMFKEDPAALLTLRRALEVVMCSSLEAFRSDSEKQKAVRQKVEAQMATKLGNNDRLKEAIIPKFAVGCRRPTPGAGFLEALVSDNVTPVYSSIKRFTEKGILTADGQEHEFDAIICASGFQIGFVPFFRLVGKTGVAMQDAWSEKADCYLGIAAPGYPNYFTPLGPRGPWGNGTVLTALEVNIDYFISMMIKMQTQDIKSCEPSWEATQEFSQHADEWHVGSVWNENCQSWYKRNGPDSKPYLWCGTTPSYMKTQSTIRFEDYKYDYIHGNRFSYIGNGRVAADYMSVDERMEKLVPYLRVANTPWEIE